MGTSHLVQVRPRWDHSHQVQVRPTYIREYPVANDPQVRTRVNRSRRGPNMDQSHCVPGESRWRPQEQSPLEHHMGIIHLVFSSTSGPQLDLVISSNSGPHPNLVTLVLTWISSEPGDSCPPLGLTRSWGHWSSTGPQQYLLNLLLT